MSNPMITNLLAGVLTTSIAVSPAAVVASGAPSLQHCLNEATNAIQVINCLIYRDKDGRNIYGTQQVTEDEDNTVVVKQDRNTKDAADATQEASPVVITPKIEKPAEVLLESNEKIDIDTVNIPVTTSKNSGATKANENNDVATSSDVVAEPKNSTDASKVVDEEAPKVVTPVVSTDDETTVTDVPVIVDTDEDIVTVESPVITTTDEKEPVVDNTKVVSTEENAPVVTTEDNTPVNEDLSTAVETPVITTTVDNEPASEESKVGETTEEDAPVTTTEESTSVNEESSETPVVATTEEAPEVEDTDVVATTEEYSPVVTTEDKYPAAKDTDAVVTEEEETTTVEAPEVVTSIPAPPVIEVVPVVVTVDIFHENEFNAALAQWAQDKQNADSTLADSVATLDTARVSLADAANAYENATAELDAAHAAYELARDNYQDAKDAHEASSAKVRADLNNASKDLAKAQEALTEAQARLQDAQQNLDVAKDSKNAASSQVDAYAKVIDDITVNIAKMTAEHDDLVAKSEVSAPMELTHKDKERLVAQATMEMINEYRVANGLAPLNTHTHYNTRAEDWSRHMADEFAETKDASGAFYHSGWNPENIVMAYDQVKRRGGVAIEDRSDEHWAAMPNRMFELWRNSPGHNANMLSPVYNGMGLGVVVDETGRVWGTTQFFNEQVDLTGNRYYRENDDTAKAKASGEAFYVAQGAREVIGATNPINTNSNGITPKYDDIRVGREGQDKTKGLETKIDSRVNLNEAPGVDYTDQVAEIDSKIAAAEAESAENSVKLAEANGVLAQAHAQVAAAETAVDEAQDDVVAAYNGVVDAQGVVDDAQRAVDTIDTTVVDQAALDFDVASNQLDNAKDRYADAEVAFETAAVATADAEHAVEVAQQQVADVAASEPQADDYVVAEEIVVEVPADDVAA